MKPYANADDIDRIHAEQQVNLDSADGRPGKQNDAFYQRKKRDQDHPESDSTLHYLSVIGWKTYPSERSGLRDFAKRFHNHLPNSFFGLWEELLCWVSPQR